MVDRLEEIKKDLKNNKIINNIPCPSWDYEGNSKIHEDKISKDFVNNIKSKYPQVQLPIEIGWTGYIDFISDDISYDGWCYDILGRFVAQINNIRIFQRYQNGDILMYLNPKNGLCWSSLDHSIMSNIFV